MPMFDTLNDRLIDEMCNTEAALRCAVRETMADARLAAGWLKDDTLDAMRDGLISRAAGSEIVAICWRLIHRLNEAAGW